MKIFYAGDSTCAQNNITTFPLTGIGQGLELYVKKEIKIHNHAVNGRSTKSFIDQGRLAVIEREINAGAVPVLITPLERRCFEDAWKLGAGEHGDYVVGMKQVAEEEHVALIDLYTKSRAKMEEVGAVETTKWFMHLAKGEYPSYPEGKVDNTHLKPEGARIFAGLVAEGLKELGGVYADLLVEKI